MIASHKHTKHDRQNTHGDKRFIIARVEQVHESHQQTREVSANESEMNGFDKEGASCRCAGLDVEDIQE